MFKGMQAPGRVEAFLDDSSIMSRASEPDIPAFAMAGPGDDLPVDRIPTTSPLANWPHEFSRRTLRGRDGQPDHFSFKKCCDAKKPRASFVGFSPPFIVRMRTA
jgi:hypothetical protein